MTNLDWMIATGRRFGISEEDANVILVNQGLEADGEVDIIKVKTALCKEFASVIPLTNVTEGGYSISWNMEAVKLWYSQMCSELGIVPVTAPKVKDRSSRW